MSNQIDVRDERVTCVSLELSKRSWLAASLPPGGEKVSLKTFASGDVDALENHLRQLQQRVSRDAGVAARVVVCHEIGYDGFWLARRLIGDGFETVVLDPASFLIARRGRRVKTDRIDAEGMVRILRAYRGGDRSVCRAVRIPSPEEEDAKRINRERQALIAERVRHVSRIRALFALQGIDSIKAINGGNWRPQLAAMRTGDGRILPPHLRREIEREFERLELVHAQLRELEDERAEAVADMSSAFPCQPKVAVLGRLKGIGAGSAATLVAEVFHRSFANRRQIAAFLGLAPSPYASGDVQHDQGISKAGNRGTRVLLVELAWCWLRYQPGSALAVWYRQRFSGRGKRAVKVGIVALARRLLIALWRYAEGGIVPEGAELRSVP